MVRSGVPGRALGATGDQLRRSNLRAVLSMVHARGPTDRAELTRELGLNRSTIGTLTAHLESLGLVTQTLPAHPARSGRPSHIVVPCRDVAVLAVAIEVQQAVVALVCLGGEVRSRVVHSDRPTTASEVASEVVSTCRKLLEAAPEVRCLGLGVSVPGIVRADDGMVRFAPNLGWVDEPFTALLQQGLKMAVHTGNDANLGVLAEHLRGAGIGVDDVVYLRGDVGVGGGFMVGGAPLRGSGGYAGEIGHLLVDGHGRACRCGAYGCWETRVGQDAVLETAGRPHGGGHAAIIELVRDADRGDPAAQVALGEAARWTGVGLRAVVDLFNPETIVLGGILGDVWHARSEIVLGSLSQLALKPSYENVHIVPAALGDDSCLLGAAELAFSELLADPQLLSSRN